MVNILPPGVLWYRVPRSVAVVSQTQVQLAPPSSVRINPKFVPIPTSSGRPAGSKSWPESGKAPFPDAVPARATTNATTAAALANDRASAMMPGAA